MARVDALGASVLQSSGQASPSSKGNQDSVLWYPAIVISTADPLQQNRLIAKIISLDENGDINGGRDRDLEDVDIPWAVPLIPQFFKSMPQVDEMVYIILSNPSENNAPRFWVGPMISSSLKLSFQHYNEAIKVLDKTEFNVNVQTDGNADATEVLPEDSDIAIQGRNDSDLILREREVFLTAGKFVKDTLTPNTEHPSIVQLIQVENTDEDVSDNDLLKSYSQINSVSTNINIYSPRGKFRGEEIGKFEINDDLKSLGDLAKTLHPAVFGDELVRVLDLIISLLLTHIHTPQNPLVPIPISEELQGYTIDGKLQNIISNHVRIN